MDRLGRFRGVADGLIARGRDLLATLTGGRARSLSAIARTLTSRIPRRRAADSGQSQPAEDTTGAVLTESATEVASEPAPEPIAQATDPPDPEPPADDYDELTKAELYRLARDLDIRGRGSMSKAELIEALRR